MPAYRIEDCVDSDYCTVRVKGPLALYTIHGDSYTVYHLGGIHDACMQVTHDFSEEKQIIEWSLKTSQRELKIIRSMSLQMLLITTKEEVEGYLEEDDEFPINDVTTTTTFNTTTQVILCIRFCILTIFLKDELEFKKVFGGLYIYVQY